MKRTVKIFPLLALLFCGIAAPAAVTFTLTPLPYSGVGSNTLVFFGTFTNSSTTTNVYLNQLQYTLTGAATNYLTPDTNAFYANVPGILLPDDNYTDPVFAINIATNTPPGVYSGTATALGGGDIMATATLAALTFQITLTNTPLTVNRTGTNALLSWPSPPASFTVQQNTNLATTNWVTLANVPAVTNGQNQVVLPVAGSTFFRLKYP
ncbi:MAG TPA: hypothetical protein VG347_20530 [Verrucomicrobiae bacterium]|nr:hypothetical protein [Verrucomicrobiae bacterium]